MLALRDSLILYHGSYASAECLALEGGASPMGFDEEAATDEQREACAVVVMRTMLEDWCDDTGAPFDDALDAFASSRTYELLFDFSSRQWASASCGSRRRTASRSARPRPGPLSPRPTAHHGNISHYVLICVSSNTFTSLFLLIFTLLRPCFCIVAEKADEEPFSRNSKGRSPSSTRAKSL